jgi:glycosyltransferase involved in cell wall biosynthesis
VDKGIRTVLATFQSVKAVLPNVTLEIFGDQDASDPIPTDLVNALGTEPGLTLRSSSPREELAQAMRHWDLLLFPSAREGLPNVVIEAAGCGVPTIGWNVTGVKDAVREGSSGYLLALGDEEEFFRSTLLSLSSAKHKFLRVGAISIAGEFSALQVQALFANYLEKLVASYKTV